MSLPVKLMFQVQMTATIILQQPWYGAFELVSILFIPLQTVQKARQEFIQSMIHRSDLSFAGIIPHSSVAIFNRCSLSILKSLHPSSVDRSEAPLLLQNLIEGSFHSATTKCMLLQRHLRATYKHVTSILIRYIAILFVVYTNLSFQSLLTGKNPQQYDLF